MSIAEVALETRRSASTVRRWIRIGVLGSIVLPSGRHVVPVEELAQLQRIPARLQNGQQQRNRRARDN